MAVHSQNGQRFQMGPESAVPGVGGTAAFRFPTLNFNMAPTGTAPVISRHAGGKEAGGVAMGDSWMRGPLGGGSNQNILDFNEVVFMAESNLHISTPSGTTAITRVYEQLPDDTDEALTYVMQRGDDSAVETIRKVRINSFGLSFFRDQPTTMSGEALGGLPVYGGSLDSATGIAQQSVASTKTGIYAPTSFGGTLTGHRISPRVTALEWHNNGKYAPYFSIDDSILGPEGFLEGQVDKGGTITIQYDVSGSDLAGITMANRNNSTLLYITALTTGPNIPGTSTPYKLQLDLALEINGDPTFDVQNNVRVVRWPFVCVPDSTAGISARLTSVSFVPAADTDYGS